MKPFAVVKIGNSVLRNPCRAISLSEFRRQSFKTFLKRMVVTMHHQSGVGLAANQAGRAVQAIVLECLSNPRYPKERPLPLECYLNPKIIRFSKREITDWEGCLSIPGYRGLVPRAESVTFTAWTPDGERVRKTVRGFHARILQHEVDHINGFFYVDRMKDLRRWTHLDEFHQKFGRKIRENR